MQNSKAEEKAQKGAALVPELENGPSSHFAWRQTCTVRGQRLRFPGILLMEAGERHHCCPLSLVPCTARATNPTPVNRYDKALACSVVFRGSR